MYDDIGGKIKGFAKVTFVIATIVAVLTGLSILFTDEYLAAYGFILLLAGPISALINSWFIYGFGQLIQNSDVLVEQSFKKQQEE